MAIDVRMIHNLARLSRLRASEGGGSVPEIQSTPSTTVLLVASPTVRRAQVWKKLGSGMTVHSYGHQDFSLDRSGSNESPLVIYQIGARFADARKAIARMVQSQHDPCIILLGGTIGSDRVARLLRDGAFDYLTWPCSAARVMESIAGGAEYQRIVHEARRLSVEVSPVTQAPTRDPDGLPSNSRQLSALYQLSEELSRSPDEDGICKALVRGLRTLIQTDMIGIARSNRKQVWIWSETQHREHEARVRRYLLRRLGRLPAEGTRPSTPQPLAHARHLRLVPRSGSQRPQPIEVPANSHERTLAMGQESGFLFVQKTGVEPLLQGERQLLDAAGTALALALQNLDATRRTQDIAMRDPLTEILNRQAFEMALTRELKVGLRYGVPACLLLLDLDYFKTVNERLGHAAGDHVLRTAAELIRSTVRDIDVVGRYEGNTFAVILPHTDRGQTRVLAERLRERIEQHPFAVEAGQVRTTASIGLAAIPDIGVASFADWMRAGDSAVNHAKAQGRNCVVLHTPQPPALACVAALSLAA
ncbi:MAG: diguanylate cyclase [Nitrospira sp.]